MPAKIELLAPSDWLAWADARSVPEPNTGCHLWLGSLSDAGRPTVSVGGKSGNAFRLLWQGVNGAIPDGLYLCHRCDNPPCINLAHGFLGTAKVNSRDMAAKGRQWLQRSSRYDNPNAKLTPEDVAYIKSVYSPSSRRYGARALGRKFGVQRETIRRAIEAAS